MKGESPLWGFEIGSDSISALSVKGSSSKRSIKSNKSFPGPPGYMNDLAMVKENDGNKIDAAEKLKTQESLKQQRMNMIASAPGKQIMMTAFMLWMSGTSINIFSIMMTGMALSSPVKSLASFGSSFEPFKGIDGLLRAQATFLFFNMIGMSFGLYKLYSMGLIPVQSSDWISLLPSRESIETFGGTPFMSG